MAAENSLIGHIIDVKGSSFMVSLIADEQGQIPIVTIKDEDIMVGQLGSYVSVRQGDVEILSIITRMAEQEKSPSVLNQPSSLDMTLLPYAQRTVWLTPLGSINTKGYFERGVRRFPTTGAEVHAIGSDTVETIFDKFVSKSYKVGKLSSNPELDVHLDPTPFFGRHFAILGQTGSGKSWTVANLVQQAISVMPHAHIIILDIHGEYSWIDESGKRGYAFADDIVQYVDARELEMPYWLMTFSELSDLLIDRTEFSAHNQIAAFKDAVNELKVKEGTSLKLQRTTLDTPIYFDLQQLRSILVNKNEEMVPGAQAGKLKKGPLTGVFDNFLMRLDSRLNDVRYDFLLNPKIRNNSASLVPLLKDFLGLGEIPRPVTIIDLSSVPFDVRPTVAAQIGRLAFEFNYWNPQYRDFPISLICEEGHIYIPRSTQSQFSGSRKSMERIAKEGRKYGVGLAVVSQRPHEVSETVLSQCGTFVCLRVTNPDDQSYIRSLVPESERDLVDILAGLGRGEAIVLGEAVPLPTRLTFFTPEPAPHSSDVDFYSMWKKDIGELDVEKIVERWRNQTR